MTKIVIKKRINLGFLGDEYKEGELVFRSIPAPEFSEITDGLPKANPRFVELVKRSDQGQLSEEEAAELAKLQVSEAESNKMIFHSLLDCLKRYFHSGKFPNDDTGELEALESADDLDGLDKDAVIKCFNILTGQDDDPKGETQSSTPSTTGLPRPENS